MFLRSYLINPTWDITCYINRKQEKMEAWMLGEGIGIDSQWTLRWREVGNKKEGRCEEREKQQKDFQSSFLLIYLTCRSVKTRFKKKEQYNVKSVKHRVTTLQSASEDNGPAILTMRTFAPNRSILLCLAINKTNQKKVLKQMQACHVEC